MPKILHIVNGDSFGDKLRASGIDGEILVWRESLYEGPIGMQLSDSVLLSMRASYMNHRYGIPEDTFKLQTLEQEMTLIPSRGKLRKLFYGLSMIYMIN